MISNCKLPGNEVDLTDLSDLSDASWGLQQALVLHLLEIFVVVLIGVLS